MSIYYKYAPYGTIIFVLSYVDYFVYWYRYEALLKWSVITIRKILHVKFLRFTNWFMSISISHIKDHSVSVYQDIYAISVVDKYLATAIFKNSKKVL